MRLTFKKLILVIAALVVIAALLYRFRKSALLAGFTWHKLGASLRNANYELLLLTLGLIFISYAIRSVRWQRFSRYMGRTHFGNVYSATIMGFTAIFLLGRAGEPVRPLLIARKDRLPIADSFGVYILERIFDAAATAAMAAIALLAIPRGSLNQSARGANMLHDARLAGWALFGALVIVVALMVYFRLRGEQTLQSHFARWQGRGGWRAKAAKMSAGFGSGLQAIRSPADLGIAVSYTALHWLVVVLVYFWIIRSFHVRAGHFGFRGALLVLAFTMVGSVVQLPAVGGGMQLSTFVVLSVIFAVATGPAAAIAICIWLVTFAAVALVGIPLLVYEGWSMGALRRLAREEEGHETHSTDVSMSEVDAAKTPRETEP